MYATKEKTRRIKYKLVDLTKVTDTSVTTDQIRTLARQDVKAAELNPKLLFISVGAKRDLEFGLSRMWSVFAENPHLSTKIFRTRDEAETWVKNHFKSA